MRRTWIRNTAIVLVALVFNAAVFYGLYRFDRRKNPSVGSVPGYAQPAESVEAEVEPCNLRVPNQRCRNAYYVSAAVPADVHDGTVANLGENGWELHRPKGVRADALAIAGSRDGRCVSYNFNAFRNEDKYLVFGFHDDASRYQTVTLVQYRIC